MPTQEKNNLRSQLEIQNEHRKEISFVNLLEREVILRKEIALPVAELLSECNKDEFRDAIELLQHGYEKYV